MTAVSEGVPMKRELKGCYICRTIECDSGFRRCPDEEGTERMLSIEDVMRGKGCFRRCPDEEGTESTC